MIWLARSSSANTLTAASAWPSTWQAVADMLQAESADAPGGVHSVSQIVYL
jgi:hypothetical protein